MITKRLICLLFNIFLWSGSLCDNITDYQNCGSTGTIHGLRIIPCPRVPCELKKRTTMGIEIDFTPNAPVEKLEILMYGVIGPAEIQFDGVSPNACDNIINESGGSLCPITNITTPVTYKNSFEVKPSYPPIPIGVKFKIADVSSKENIVCLKFDSKITV